MRRWLLRDGGWCTVLMWLPALGLVPGFGWGRWGPFAVLLALCWAGGLFGGEWIRSELDAAGRWARRDGG